MRRSLRITETHDFTDLRSNNSMPRGWTGVCTGWAIMAEQHNHSWRINCRSQFMSVLSRICLKRVKERWQIMKTAITSPIIFHQPSFLVLIFHVKFSWTDTKSAFAQLSVCYGFDKMPPANLICQVHILIIKPLLERKGQIFSLFSKKGGKVSEK